MIENNDFLEMKRMGFPEKDDVDSGGREEEEHKPN